MLRWGSVRLASAGAKMFAVGVRPSAAAGVQVRRSSHATESDEEIDARYIAYFNRADIDGWEVRKAMTDLIRNEDSVPEPAIIVAAMKACRRVNDFALTVRFLESVKSKCAHRVDEIYPYIIQEIKPTLVELGISTPEELGYDKPELALIPAEEL